MTIRKVHIPGTVTTKKDVLRFIENCYDKDVLRELHAGLRDQADRIMKMNMRMVKINDRVRFNTNKYGPLVGVVTDVKRAKVCVTVENMPAGHNPKWRVHGSSLEVI